MPGTARGPVRDSERRIAPDLARGFALLFIAIANTPFYLWGTASTSPTSFHPVPESTADTVTQFLIVTMVDGRTYPLFAFLFGYGIVQLYRRQVDASGDEHGARRLLRRRHLWLIAFGAAHALLLWVGDVLGAWGLAGLVLVGIFFRRRDRTLMVWAWVFTGLLALFAGFAIVGGVFVTMLGIDGTSDYVEFDLQAPAATSSYLLSMLMRISFWPLQTIGQGLLSLVTPVAILFAFWAARRGILENPGEHLTLLRGTAIVGIAIGWLGGLPSALVQIGVFPSLESAPWMFAGLSSVTGLFAGLGYAALFGLIGYAIERRRSEKRRLGLSGALAAVGKRSLSAYLMQSVLCAPLLAGWGFGLGAMMGSFDMALFATAVWAITVLLAAIWESRGWKGPAEILLRRLVYRR